MQLNLLYVHTVSVQSYLSREINHYVCQSLVKELLSLPLVSLLVDNGVQNVKEPFTFVYGSVFLGFTIFLWKCYNVEFLHKFYILLKFVDVKVSN